MINETKKNKIWGAIEGEEVGRQFNSTVQKKKKHKERLETRVNLAREREGEGGLRDVFTKKRGKKSANKSCRKIKEKEHSYKKGKSLKTNMTTGAGKRIETSNKDGGKESGGKRISQGVGCGGKT